MIAPPLTNVDVASHVDVDLAVSVDVTRKPRGLCIALVALLAACGGNKSDRALDDLGPIPEFSLVDHHGTPIDQSIFTGKITVADFIFTRCETVCPVVTLRMKRVQEKSRGLADQVQLLSFSVDPAYDTPERLAAYAAKAGADDDRWRFVTGDPDAVQELMDFGFKVPMDPGGLTDAGAPNVIHSQHFVLVDQRGHLRGYYDSSEISRIDKLLEDLRRLAR